MSTAAILKNGTIVSTDGFTNLKFYKSGHLTSFKNVATNKVYHHFTKTNELPEGYFNKDAYLKFIAGIINNHKLIEKFTEWKNPKENDDIIIEKRVITYTGTQLMSIRTYCLHQYKKGYSENLTFSSNDISIDGFTIIPEKTRCNYNLNSELSAISEIAANYFERNIKVANIDDQEFINIIADITFLISYLDSNIYYAFESYGYEDNLKVNQRNQWSFDSVINGNYSAKKKDYVNYLQNLIDYRNLTEKYFTYISNASSSAKAVNIASSMHPLVLMQMPVERKLELLKYIVKNYVKSNKIINYIKNEGNFLNSKTVQNLIVNLCLSFDGLNATQPSIGNSSIDQFLSGLLEFDTYENKTLFEIVYDYLNQPFNITEGLIGISNAAFKTDYKPNNSRGMFIQAVYNLWQFSKYNPFDFESFDNNIKPETLGFKILDNSENSIAKFDNEYDSGNIGCLFYYTSEIGYETYNVTESLTIGDDQEFTLYKQKYENASPIVLPYESNSLLGIFNDNFNFSFEGKKIIATQNKPTDTNYNNDWNSNYRTFSDLIYGIYDIYQPVTIINTDIDTKSPLLTTTIDETQIINGTAINSLIPLFVLKYIDDAGDQSDAENMLGYVVDGLLTFSGIGNLTKLKHLRWAALAEGQVGLFTKQGLRIVFGGIEFSAGVIGFFANFVSCDPPSVPQNSTNPEHIEAWENYRFCESMKTFITVFQFATLSITVGDTITSLALKKQAARVIKNAGGGIDEATILNNLENKLGTTSSGANQQLVEEVAEKISDLGKAKYLNAAADLLIEINKIYYKIQPKILNRISNGNGVFNKKFFNLNFGENNLKIIIQDFIQNGINDQKIIEDFVTFACRVDQKIINPVTGQVVGTIIKGYTFTESRTIINYYANVILKRGFVTGFYNLQDYKLFSLKAKVFLDDFCQKRGISNAKYEVQGSVQYKSHDLDPNVNDVPVLTRDGIIIKPDDFDGRIYISKNQANNYLKGLERDYRKQLRLDNPTWTSSKINEKVDMILINVKKGINKGMIRKDYIKPDGFLDDLKQAVKRENGTDIFFPLNSSGVSEVGFSIIIKGSPYDVYPVFPLKY